MKKILALLLALCMIFALAACGETAAPAQEEAPAAEPAAEEPAAEPAAEEPAAEEPAAEEPAPEKKATEDTPLVVGYSPFNSKFSPFFSETAYDQDVAAMVSLYLLNTDREGNVVTKGIDGEKIPYNGTEYTYYGIADR